MDTIIKRKNDIGITTSAIHKELFLNKHKASEKNWRYFFRPAEKNQFSKTIKNCKTKTEKINFQKRNIFDIAFTKNINI